MCFDDDGSDGPGRGTERLPDKAAPIVPDEREKAVDELRPSVFISLIPCDCAQKKRGLTVWSRDYHIYLAGV